MPGWLLIISLAIFVLSLPAPWLQAQHIFRLRSTEGLSATTQLMLIWASIAWGWYGLQSGNWALSIVNASAALAGVLIVAGAVFYGGYRPLRAIASTGLFIAAFAATIALGNPVALMIVSGMLTFASRIPQAYRSFKQPGGNGVSVSSFAVNAVVLILWMADGLLLRDWFLLGTSAVGLAFAVFVILRTTSVSKREKDLRFERELQAAILYERHQRDAARPTVDNIVDAEVTRIY